jgi:GTPase
VRSGFAALIGRPNVGKSTLLNRLVGTKVAIVSPKPQTTRGRTLGIVTNESGQVVFVDTPGIHEAAGPLNAFMVDVALHAAAECDVVLFMIDAEGQHEDKTAQVSAGNRLVIEKLKHLKKPTFLLVNKIDTIKKVLMLPLIDCYQTEFPFVQVFPVSARRGEGLEILVEALISQMPEGEYLYPAESFTDQSERALVAEYVREKVLRHCHQEIPYSTAVVVEVFDEEERDKPPPKKKNAKKKLAKKKAPAEGEVAAEEKKPELAGLIRIHANIYVERDSQKAIIIGKNGQMLKTIGTDARLAIQRLLGTHVFLSLQVKVEPRWTETMGGLAKLGYRLGG